MDSSTSLVVRIGSEDGKRAKKELSEDDIVEILVKLPVKSLLRFKSVSKLWYSLILSPSFIAMHYEHSQNKEKSTLLCFKYYVETPRKTTVPFQFGDVPKNLTFRGPMPGQYIEIVGCFNGVVCLSLSQRPQKYTLWNPATKKFRQIGGALMDGPYRGELPPTISYESYDGWYDSGFCFDPVTNAFKVGQFKLTVTQEGETRAQVNVFSTATNSWTEKNIAVPCRIRSSGSNIIHGATCVNGYMHWFVAMFNNGNTFENGLLTSLSSKLEDMYILSYNMADEVFQRIEMPFPVYVKFHLAAYKGSLAVFVHMPPQTGIYYDEVDVWVLNDCGGSNQSWSKILTCRPSIKVILAAGFFRKDNVDLVLLCKEPDCSLYCYDPENGETKKLGTTKTVWKTFLYSESLASLH